MWELVLVPLLTSDPTESERAEREPVGGRAASVALGTGSVSRLGLLLCTADRQSGGVLARCLGTVVSEG